MTVRRQRECNLSQHPLAHFPFFWFNMRRQGRKPESPARGNVSCRWRGAILAFVISTGLRWQRPQKRSASLSTNRGVSILIAVRRTAIWSAWSSTTKTLIFRKKSPLRRGDDLRHHGVLFELGLRQRLPFALELQFGDALIARMRSQSFSVRSFGSCLDFQRFQGAAPTHLMSR